jgi:trimeric autotransporter adhesin
VVIASLFASACSSGSSGQEAPCTGSSCGPGAIQSLSIVPAVAFLPVGEQQSLRAQATYFDGTVVDITTIATWSAPGSTAVSIVGAGVVKGNAIGSATVVVTLQGHAASARVTVTAAQAGSLSVTPSAASVARGTSAPLVAFATFTDGSVYDVTGAAAWSSSDASVAVVSAGMVTGRASGSAVVTASLSGLSSTATITVTDAVLTAITVAPELPAVPAGARIAFTAIGHFSDLTSQDVTTLATWSTSDSSVATIATAGSASALRAGSTTVRATMGSVSGATVLTVTSAALTALTVNPATTSVPVGVSQPLTVTGTFSDGTTQDLSAAVTWASSNAQIASISSAGLLVGVGVGQARVTATLGGLSAVCDATVTAATLQALSLSPASATLAAGYEVQLAATGVYSDGSVRDVTSQASWTTSNGAVATLSSGPGTQGLVRGVAAGAATITTSLAGRSASAPIEVTAAVLTAIAVTPEQPSVPAGVKTSFAAIGIFSDQTSADLTSQVTWSVANPAVATLTSSGVATAIHAGDTTVSASLGSQIGSTTMTVVAATLQAIEVVPPDASIVQGTTTTLQAMGTFSDGSVVDLTPQAVWVSDAATVSISVVRGAAIARGEAAGSANVTATFSGLSDTSIITVSSATLTALSVSPASSSLPVGLTQQLSATGTYSDASTQDLTAQVAWSSSDVQVAAVSSTGLVTMLKAGSARITATLLGLSGGSDATVTAVTLQGITISPPNGSVAAGYKVQLKATGSYSDGSSYDLTGRVLWSSSSPSVATVSNKQGNQGLVTGVATGTSTITAATGSVSGSATVSVTTARLASIAVTPNPFAVGIRQTTQLEAVGTFDDGTTQVLTRQCAWTSSAKRTARVSQAGVVTGSKKGTATITASKSGRSGSAVGTVN